MTKTGCTALLLLTGVALAGPADQPATNAASTIPPTKRMDPPVHPPAPGYLSLPGETIDTWHGYKRHLFWVDGCRAWVVEPKNALPGKPWSWCLQFPDAFTDRTPVPALLEAGYHHAHVVVGNTFGSPEAIGHFNAFYRMLTKAGFSDKVVLIGLSRGGLYAYRWASENPDKVAVIYGDAPVCDMKSWPAGKLNGKGEGKPMNPDWTAAIKCYGFKDEAEALAYPGNPVDTLAPLAKAGVPIIHVVGDADPVVPVAENTAVVEERYKKMGAPLRSSTSPASAIIRTDWTIPNPPWISSSAMRGRMPSRRSAARTAQPRETVHEEGCGTFQSPCDAFGDPVRSAGGGRSQPLVLRQRHPAAGVAGPGLGNRRQRGEGHR